MKEIHSELSPRLFHLPNQVSLRTVELFCTSDSIAPIIMSVNDPTGSVVTTGIAMSKEEIASLIIAGISSETWRPFADKK
mmetsp:Transcript_16731/g.24732  ORF Transcript_16731/g.24732 Transcript_16731/m.24732 type:complete len:80 (+) Transcript_16731:120-359(+)